MHNVDNYVDKSEVMHKLWISIVDKMWITFLLYYLTNTVVELYRESIAPLYDIIILLFAAWMLGKLQKYEKYNLHHEKWLNTALLRHFYCHSGAWFTF